MEELAQKGPLKPEELRGIDKYEKYTEYALREEKSSDITVKQGLGKLPPKVGVKLAGDKALFRTGWILDDDTTKMMLKHINEAKMAIHKDQVTKKVPLSEKTMLEHIDILRGVIMISYPGYYGLGVWEPARVLLESKDLDAYYEPDDDEVRFSLF